MYCPKCLSGDIYVIDTRNRVENARRRRYKCETCGHRFSTIEVVAEAEYFESIENPQHLVRISALALKFANDVANIEK